MPRPAAQQLLVFALALATAGTGKGGGRMALSLSSTAFQDGTAIPLKYTCDGADVSPPLAWNGAPPRAAAFALIADDPDAPAGTWVHWVLYNVPRTAPQLPDDVPKADALPHLRGAHHGPDDDRRAGYEGRLAAAGP